VSTGERLRDEDVARVLGAYGTLGDGTTARIDRGVLTVARGLDVRRVFWSLVFALALAGALVLAMTCHRAIVYDRFASFTEVVASVSPALLIAVLGAASARPTKVEIHAATRAVRVGRDERSLEGRTLSLSREGWDDVFDVMLDARDGRRLIRLRGVDAYSAARAKAIAIALASWLDLPLVETSTTASRASLHDADAVVGLATPRAKPARAEADRSRAKEVVETVVDVAVFAIEVLNAL
jgi:hypothetical protein